MLPITLMGQNKKEVQFTLDTLIKVHESLLNDYKDLQQQWKDQNEFFEHVKQNFFPAEDINLSIKQASVKFDDVYKDLENKVVKLGEINKSLSDSLKKQISVNQDINIRDDIYKDLILSSLNQASFPKSESDLQGKWNLFLNPVLLQGNPYESGITGINPFVVKDSIASNKILSIEFQKDELATIRFSGDVEQKCFYAINDFNATKPYSIQFSKQDEFKLTLMVSPMPDGLMVSYEVPEKTKKVIYYLGLMKQ